MLQMRQLFYPSQSSLGLLSLLTSSMPGEQFVRVCLRMFTSVMLILPSDTLGFPFG